MGRPDWRNPHDYSSLQGCSAAQWAWEFLRRNPAYRREWADFDATWRELEKAYGSPPDRDFCAWKLDPRAWVPAAECSGSDCRVDGDKVLIECAMGARWGFHKFPPSPEDDDPVGEGRLIWRQVTAEARLLEDKDCTDASGPAQVLAEFDLSLPLQDQLSWIKRRLQILQRERVKAGLIKPPRIAAHLEQLRRFLRLLDGVEAKADRHALKAHIYAGASVDLEAQLSAANAMRDKGYRQLLLLE